MRMLLIVALVSASCSAAPQYDVVIRHGTVYDGTAKAGVVEDLAIQDDARRNLAAWRARP